MKHRTKKKETDQVKANPDDKALDRIQENTRDLMNTHTTLLENIEKIRPFLQEVEHFANTLKSSSFEK